MFYSAQHRCNCSCDSIFKNRKYGRWLLSWLSNIMLHVLFDHMSSEHKLFGCLITELKHWRGSCAQLAQGRMLDKQWGHGCNSHSIRCVQIGGSNNSIAAANSLTARAWVQKSWIMQWRPAGICCPTAISFNIGQASVGITHWLNKSCRQQALL